MMRATTQYANRIATYGKMDINFKKGITIRFQLLLPLLPVERQPSTADMFNKYLIL